MKCCEYGPRGLYHKPFHSRNKFFSKLVSVIDCHFLLVKTNTIASICYIIMVIIGLMIKAPGAFTLKTFYGHTCYSTTVS
jgi:hypothetical protein